LQRPPRRRAGEGNPTSSDPYPLSQEGPVHVEPPDALQEDFVLAMQAKGMTSANILLRQALGSYEPDPYRATAELRLAGQSI